jgi:hypothetical protein
MLRRTFNVSLSDKELGAVLERFDVDRVGKILCSSFLVYFSKVGISGRGQLHTASLERQRQEQQRQEEEEQAKLVAAWQKLELRPDELLAFTQQDEEVSHLTFVWRQKERKFVSSILPARPS